MVQEYTSPGEVKVAPEENLTQALWENARAYPTRPALSYRSGDQYVDVSTKSVAETVTRLAAGIIALGIEPGSRICVMSATRIEWTYLDFAIWAAGCVTVPIYETSSTEQIEWIVSNSGAVAIFLENADLRASYEEVAKGLKDVEHVYVIEDGALDAVMAEGTDVTDEQVMERANAVQASDLATLVYTSGTTGRPKGCELTHSNFVWDVKQVAAAASEFFAPGESTLLFLPLAHIFARVIQVSTMLMGVKLGFSTGIPQLSEELQMFKPTFVLSVPRVFEKVFNRVQQKAHSEGKGKIFDKATQVAIDFSRESQEGSVSLKTKLAHAVFDKLVYSKIREALGGRARYAVSGGAALGERLGHFYNGIGVRILEGYGLTETSAAATINRPNEFRIGTVGKPIPGAGVRIAEDGEVLLKGGNVFVGYYKNDEATKEAIEADGWFHTGDIGELDKDGFLRITGRKKELIVTAAGKNVAPNVLEDRLRANRLVSQCMVVGDGEKFIACLVTIDADEFPAWAEENGKTGKSIADLTEDADLRAAIQLAIEDANKAVSRAESIREFRILPEDFTIEGGEMTPSLKVKRNVVAEKYGHVIEAMYGRA